jgi:2-polyprenyl-6-methoxyphenol hydroxylase-like FAD-dependent oxidoreductase
LQKIRRMNPDVLVVGAGPTGLVLALWLTRMGVRVRIVDKAAHSGTTSRAVGVHARTLELYEALDLAQPLVEAGVKAHTANLWARGTHFGQVDLLAASSLSRYPFMLVYPQDRHEALLEARLAESGVHVEREIEVTELDGDAATLRRADGTTELVSARYIAGCDGAHSIVRHALGIEFGGGTYSHLFYVADVEASGPTMNGELHIAFDDADFLACFPLDGTSHARLIGDIKRDVDDHTELTWQDVSQRIIERLQTHVERVNWFSTYRVHHRVATKFAADRAFLLGDAAHIHSPVGGQGMNTGIGDAINLAWKLAAVIHGRADERILVTYSEERMPFARRLVATTDRAFEVVASDGKLAKAIRNDVLPRVIPKIFHFESARRLMFRLLSQIEIEYRDSALSEGKAGHVRGGDRLPWVESLDNFAPLHSLAWQVHVYGDASPKLRAECDTLHLPLHAFAWCDAAHAAGLARDAAYVVRPDGYVGLATTTPTEVAAYFDEQGVRP